MDYSYQFLPLLVAIIEEKHLGRAAARLGLSQPAVSRALAKLREQYQDPLVTRTATGVTPTLFAQQIYPVLLRSLSEIDLTFASNATFNPHARAYRFAIACTSLVNYSFIPNIIEAFSQHYPNIHIDIFQLGQGDTLAQLRSKACDFLIDIDTDYTQALRKRVLYRDSLVLSCRKAHPRINQVKVSLEEFLAEQHVTVSNWKSRGYVFNNEHFSGIESRKVAATTVGTIESLRLVSKTDYVCLADASNVKIFSDFFGIKAVALPFENIEYDVCLYWHPSREQDQALIWFRQEILRLIKSSQVM